MANVRFLDQVPVSAYATNAGVTKVPRFLYAGEVLNVPANQQLVGWDFFNFGLVVINAGDAVVIGNDTYYSHGLLQIQSIITNEGIIENNGVLVNSEQFI